MDNVEKRLQMLQGRVEQINDMLGGINVLVRSTDRQLEMLPWNDRFNESTEQAIIDGVAVIEKKIMDKLGDNDFDAYIKEVVKEAILKAVWDRLRAMTVEVRLGDD